MSVSITCPRCGRTSYNPNDVTAGYCGACHEFTTTYGRATGDIAEAVTDRNDEGN